MRRIAVLAVVVMAGCSSSGGVSVPESTTSGVVAFDVDAAEEAWLAEVAPFVPDAPTLDAAIAAVERGCLADDATEVRSAEVAYSMNVQSGSSGPVTAAMEAGCADLPAWFVAAGGS